MSFKFPSNKEEINGLGDIEATHLDQRVVYVSPPIFSKYIDAFNFTIEKFPLLLSDFTRHVVNLGELPDSIVSKTSIHDEQGETVYIRFSSPLTQFAETGQTGIARLPFAIDETQLVLLDEETKAIDYNNTPVYVLGDALTKGSPYKMNRYYATRNNYYALKLLKEYQRHGQQHL